MQEGIEKVEAAYAVFFKNSLEDFQHFSFELQTVAEQSLTAERIKSYLAIIHQHREIEETYKVTKGILLVLGKYLQMMVAYRIFKEDNVELQFAPSTKHSTISLSSSAGLLRMSLELFGVLPMCWK